MKLVRLAAGTRWTVYAVFAPNDEDCPLLDFINELEPSIGDRVLSDLREHVPETAPSHWARTEFSNALSGSNGILEFRWPRGRGGTPRVLWFYDANRVIVCSHGVNKKGGMRAVEIAEAEEFKRRYRLEKAAGRIEIVDFEDLE
jgi:Phage derived protein Gp49-like (DUF891)